MPQLYSVTHSSPELKTVGEYLESINSPGFSYNKKPQAFLELKGDDGLTNFERITASYKLKLDLDKKTGDPRQLPLKVGTLLYVECDQVNQGSFAVEGIEVVSTNEPAFKAAKLIELEADPGYRKAETVVTGMKSKGGIQSIYPDLTVWIWCRALSAPLTNNPEEELEGEIFDLTPFIQSCSTSMGKNGGNFQITLPPLVCELVDQKWVIKKYNLNRYIDETDPNFQKNGYVAEGSLLSEIEGELKTNEFLFKNIISANDLIFIRFETLHMEKEQRYADADNFYINKSNIANRIYDMIGLIDNVLESVNPSNNDVSISVQGRDLSKLFLEDGTYFYALENSQGMLKFAGQSTQKNSLINRIFSDGALSFIGLYNFTSIEYILKFIIQQLSTIQIVPESLFKSYSKSVKNIDGRQIEYDARNTRFVETDLLKKPADPNLTYKPQYKKELAAGIWQIVKLVVDESVVERRLCDSSLSTANGALMNFLRSAIQEPLCELYMDTYKDMYHLIVRKPPYDRKALISLIEGKVNSETKEVINPPAIVDIEAEDVLDTKLAMNDSQVYSWYHFFPKNSFFGEAQSFNLAYLGALYFEEYAKVWGSKPFQQSHTYLPYIPLVENKSELDITEKQAIHDLAYVVESNQYLPFTRKGTIVLNGDRRIKIGNVIRYKPTGEIFFVDAVKQSFTINENTIDRTTVINVSRGMVEQLIYGVQWKGANGTDVNVSYFNIINTNLNFKEHWYDEEQIITTPVQPKQPVSKETINALKHPEMVIGARYLETYDYYPANKAKFIEYINAINDLGYEVLLVEQSTNRTFIQQAALKKLNKNNASPGTSKHEFGQGIDITIRKKDNNKFVCTKSTSQEQWESTGVPQLAKSMGIQWGDKTNTGTFGSYIDRVHFQLINSAPLQAPIPYSEKKVKVRVKGIDREAIFSNFKVDKYVFNYFLKNLQFDSQYKKVGSRTILESTNRN